MKLIAETAWHHQGEFEFLRQLVSAIISQTSADIIKLHITLYLKEYISKDHPLFNDYKKWMFSRDQWGTLFHLIQNSDKELMLLLNDTQAVEFGMSFDPSLVEIHSVCLNDINLLEALKQNLNRSTRIALGVGGTSLYEIEKTINILQSPNIVMMFGFQNYPTKYEDINFGKMRRIMRLFPEFQFGYSDHTAWNEPHNVLITLLGASIGVDYIEKHVTTAYGEERIDWSAAVSVEMFNEIKNKMDLLVKCNGDSSLSLNKAEREYSIFGPMKKAALLTRDVKSGEALKKEMIAFKRTSQVSDMSQVEVLQSIGKTISQNINKGKVLKYAHLEEDKEVKLK